jgi:hypothetical protein
MNTRWHEDDVAGKFFAALAATSLKQRWHLYLDSAADCSSQLVAATSLKPFHPLGIHGLRTRFFAA